MSVATREDGGQSIRGGGVGGAPPPRTGFAPATYPTTPHSATQNPLNAPHWRYPVTLRTQKPWKSRPFPTDVPGRRQRKATCTAAGCTRVCTVARVRGPARE